MIIYIDLNDKDIKSGLLEKIIKDTIGEGTKRHMEANPDKDVPFNFQVVGLAGPLTPNSVVLCLRNDYGYQVILHPEDETAPVRDKTITLDLVMRLGTPDDDKELIFITKDTSFKFLRPYARANGKSFTVKAYE